MVFDPCQNDSFGFMGALAFFGPFSSRMNYVPIRPCLLVSSAAGVMVSKAIYGSVPKRAIKFNEGGLDGANHVRTCMLKNDEPAHEIISIEIRGEL